MGTGKWIIFFLQCIAISFPVSYGLSNLVWQVEALPTVDKFAGRQGGSHGQCQRRQKNYCIAHQLFHTPYLYVYPRKFFRKCTVGLPSLYLSRTLGSLGLMAYPLRAYFKRSTRTICEIGTLYGFPPWSPLTVFQTAV